MSGTLSRWIPLESNPDVLNQWASKAGLVTSRAEFVDIYGLDGDLLAMVPQPVEAVILLFPISEYYETRRKEEDENIKNQGQHPIDPTVFYIKQTIGNACGTIGLLHALANADVTLVPESPLEQFIDQCKELTPEERAKVLETTPLFANIHAEAASSGQSVVTEAVMHTDLHFACFVQAPDPPRDDIESANPRRLLELDGRRAGPVDRGASTNLLQDVAKYVKDTYVAQTTSVQFSMMALVPSQ
ncbi:peptidase C12, ubiquitin carboxyl-terminal hydrolase 1 [Daedalea quercina L-15889]|uniref:Ubiquitin carboxyl-terminal hydrolase n=1 Tax=Daedalea quercina L-15889 TaxID=1314783 RepID=A0A165MJ89_9APHY|nr:peptidase C12, ubiquitin carboxyl-terminal hydrolase 1 [Daedalea quercina L-15889]